MQRYHSNRSPHSREGCKFFGRGVRSFADAPERYAHIYSLARLSPADALQPISLSWWVMTQPAASVAQLPDSARSLTSVTKKSLLTAPIGGALKRVMDVAVAALALLLLLPLLFITALLIKITMGGSVLYAHSRVGVNGKNFPCYKFRTMVADADEQLRLHLARDPHVAREWQQACKLAHDPRVTPLGRILRKASIDELPQLINVLRGDMSCVGPRPVVAGELERYGPQAADYLKTRPGLTGLWQVSGRNSLSYANRVALDSLYVHNWSIFLDAAILIRTIPAIVKFDQTA